jgi:hypothetical protein
MGKRKDDGGLDPSSIKPPTLSKDFYNHNFDFSNNLCNKKEA